MWSLMSVLVLVVVVVVGGEERLALVVLDNHSMVRANRVCENFEARNRER